MCPSCSFGSNGLVVHSVLISSSFLHLFNLINVFNLHVSLLCSIFRCVCSVLLGLLFYSSNSFRFVPFVHCMQFVKSVQSVQCLQFVQYVRLLLLGLWLYSFEIFHFVPLAQFMQYFQIVQYVCLVLVAQSQY